jgi:hypothetical protein
MTENLIKIFPNETIMDIIFSNIIHHATSIFNIYGQYQTQWKKWRRLDRIFTMRTPNQSRFFLIL